MGFSRIPLQVSSHFSTVCKKIAAMRSRSLRVFLVVGALGVVVRAALKNTLRSSTEVELS